MALTTLAAVQAIPGMANKDETWLTQLIAAASEAIKQVCKLRLESQEHTEYYSGNGLPDLVLRQWPVTAVESVHVDPTGYAGQAAGAFPATTEWAQGENWMLVPDTTGGVSRRGLLRVIAGTGNTVWLGMYPAWGVYPGKLHAARRPCWPPGDGNIKVVYTAGYAAVPADLQYACGYLVSEMVRNMPVGGPLASESLGAYSYSIAQRAMGDGLDLSHYGHILRRYMEASL